MVTPDDGVLFMTCAKHPGLFSRQAEHQKALLTGPAVRRVLAESLDIGQAVLFKLAYEHRLPRVIRRIVQGLAKWIAGGDVSARFNAVGFV